MTKIELKIAEHNRIVKAQTKRSFMNLQPMLRVFCVSHPRVIRLPFRINWFNGNFTL